MPRKCGPRDQVHVAGRRVGLDRDARRAAPRPARRGRRTCCRSRPAPRGPSSADRRLGALEDDVLVGQRDARAGRTAPGGPGRPPGTAAARASSPSTAARNVAILGSSPSRGSPGPGPTMTRSAPSSAPSAYVVVADDACWSCPARRARGAACSRSRPRRRGSTDALARPARASGGAPDWSVEPERREPLVARVEREQHVLVVDQLGDVDARRRRRRAPARTRARMPPALACVSATSYAGSESRTRVAPAVTVSRPSRSTSAVRITIGLSTIGRAVGVAAEQRQRGAVVAAALGLVLLDQPAGVLDRAAGDGRGVHRVAQHLARVAAGAAGQEVLGVHQVASSA